MPIAGSLIHEMATNNGRPGPDIAHVVAALRAHDQENEPAPPDHGEDARVDETWTGTGTEDADRSAGASPPP